MKYDPETHDGMVLLSFDKRIGLFSFQTITKQARNVRTAGQLPAEASAHTLQAVALTNALRSISKSHAIGLTLAASTPKPRLLIVSEDVSFLNSLLAKIKNDRESLATKPLKAASNFLLPLAYQLGRFEVTFTRPEVGDTGIPALKAWTYQQLISPKEFAGIAAALAPMAMAQNF